MKKIKFLAINVALLLSAVVFTTSCSKKPDFASLIPADAWVVADYNLKEIATKGDFKHFNDLSFVKLIRQELRSDGDPQSTAIDNIFDDPSQTGLDIKGDMVIYAHDADNIGVIMAMDNMSKFEKFVHQLADDDLEIEKTASGMRIVRAGMSGLSVAWDKEKVLLCASQNDDIEALMNLPKEQSLASNDDFARFWKERRDANIWFSMNEIFEMAESFGGSDAINELDTFRKDLENATVHMLGSFEKGVIRNKFITNGIDPDSDIMKMMQQKFDAKLLAFMPEKSFAAMAMTLEMRYFVATMERMGLMHDALNEEIGEGVTVADLLTAAGGNLMASLYDFGQSSDGNIMPLFAAAVSLNDPAKMSQMLDKLNLEKQNGCWSLPSVPLYFGIKDDVLFATDDAQAAASMMQQGYANGMKDFRREMEKGNFFFADLDIDHYPASVSGLLPADLRGLLGQFLDHMEYTSTSATEGEYCIYLKNKKQNSLAALFHFVDDNLLALSNLADAVADGLGNTDGDYDEAEYYPEEDLDYFDED